MVWIQVRAITTATLTLGLITTGAAGFALRQDPQPTSPATAPAAPPVPPLVDPAARLKLRAQEIAVKKAQGRLDLARATRVLAQLAIEEYNEVTYPRDLAATEAEIARARADLMRAEDRLAWSKKRVKAGQLSQATLVSDQLTLERAKFEVEQVLTQRDVLTKYTRDKTLRDLTANRDKAAGDESIKLANLEVELLNLSMTSELGLEPKPN